MSENNPLLRRVYALDGDKEETRRVYAEWAEQYDRDTLDGMGYVAPGLVAKELSGLVAKDAKVLDAGCGTGLAGVELKKLGFTNIDGIDLSGEMLEVAREKEAYDKLAEADMTVPLEIADDSYDAVISVGVFTSGHVKPKALDELARVTRKGGQIVVTVHEKVWEADGYPDYLEDMEKRGLVSIRAVKEAPYHRKEGYSCQICVLEVL
ncbi:class I SAM-dependent DNA methyltransferase [Fodinicurvata fenggangensis]|uniref:class I SAM-dependent DNA methyltransferase n=1 Tax=Fodinicurvata fenggangensis TaxID=1121830 RepID=UPI00047B81F7|nr:class I SAM-dependent methyltransferase [Fodinicurvata fenggangensis]